MIRVALVDGDRLYSADLQKHLEEDNEVSVVASISDESAAMGWIQDGGSAGCDCVVINLQLPRELGYGNVSTLSGLRIIEKLRRESRFAGIILVMSSSRSLCDGERALAAGSDGYITKVPRDRLGDLVELFRVALRGEVVLVARELRHGFFRARLSAKESTLMELIDRGLSWAEVAKRLGYKSGRAAANMGYRVFDKILTQHDRYQLSEGGENKRDLALHRWRAQVRPRQ